MQEALVYIENNLINSDSDMYLTGDSLIEINSVITGSSNVTVRNIM